MDKKYCEVDSFQDYDLDDFNIDTTNDEDNCINCFHSDGKYCYCKQQYINISTPICWCYRDCFSMRVKSRFQDQDDLEMCF